MANNIIKFENFGPITDASFTISPLTIFIGPNSSGKSFSSLAIHNFLKNFSGENNASFGINSLNCLLQNNKDLFCEFDSIFKNFIIKKPKLNTEPLSISIEFFNTLLIDGIGKYYAYLIENNLKKLFKDDLTKLINFYSNSFKISFNGIEFQYEDILNINSFIIYDDVIYSINKEKVFKIEFTNNEVFIYLNYPIFSQLTDNNNDTSLFYIFLAGAIFDIFNQGDSYYIPSSRDELVQDTNSYISKEINGIVKFSKTQKELASYLLNMDNNSRTGYFYDISREMEDEILNGEIDIYKNKFGNNEIKFKDIDTSNILELDQVSSAIKEVTPIILYLKYQLKKGDTLIIEEPEAHLHPKNQRILVKYFVKLINSGLNIILTTHSDL